MLNKVERPLQPFEYPSQQDQDYFNGLTGPIRKDEFWKKVVIFGLPATGSLIAACTPAPPPPEVRVITPTAPVPTPTLIALPNEGGYSLDLDGRQLVDRRVSEEPSSNIRSLRFGYDRERLGGSLTADLCFDAAERRYRVASYEDSPNRRWLVNRDYATVAGCDDRRFPIIEFRRGDREIVFIGEGANDQETFVNMRVYRATRTDQQTILDGIAIEYLGQLTVNPSNIVCPDPGSRC